MASDEKPDWYYSLSTMRLKDMPFGGLRANLFFFLNEQGLLGNHGE